MKFFNQGTDPDRILWLVRGLCLLALAAMLGALYVWCGRKSWSHDEIENIHAGWLIFRGQIPYTDFFHHKPPFYWQFISLYYRFAGEDLGVMLWARHVMLFTFGLAVLFTFLLARELFDEWSAWAAAALLAGNSVVHYPAVEPREQGWMVALLLAGLWVYLRAWRRDFSRMQAVLAGFLLGASYALHPRAGFPILALALVSVYDLFLVRGWRSALPRMPALLLFAAAALGMVSIPYFLYGPGYHYCLYEVSLHVAEVDLLQPWGLFKNLYFSGYGMGPLVLAGLLAAGYGLRGSPGGRLANFAALTFFALGNAQVLSNPKPFVQSFYSLIPFAALLGAAALHVVFRHLPVRASAAGAACLVVASFLSNENPSYRTAPDEYTGCLNRAKFLQGVIPENERFLGDMEEHPIFRLPGSIYWFDMRHVLRSRKLLDPAFQHEFADELSMTRPYMLGANIMKWVAFDPPQEARFKAWLEQNYTKLPTAPFLVRNDALERVLDPAP